MGFPKTCNESYKLIHLTLIFVFVLLYESDATEYLYNI